MARVINFNNIPVLITGDHPVIDLILKELSPFPSTNKSAEIKFNITLSEIHPERGSLNLGSGIYATKDSLYIDLSKDFYYYIKISKDQNSWRWNIDISCTTTGIPNNPFGRFFEFLHKIKDWTYLTEIEKMAYHIINGVFEPFILFLTRGERTFLHASSIVKDNDAVLISGRGGTGKTSTCVELVCESGWKFLSDDISLIGVDGIAYLYPRYIMMYAYNVEENKKLFYKLMEKRSFIDRLQWEFKKRRNGLKGVRRRVPAEVIFGRDKIGNRGRISKVIHLIRCNSNSFILRETNARALAVMNTGIIMEEYYYYLKYMTAWQSSGYSPVTIGEIIKRNQNIFTRAFKNADCFIVFVPQKTTPKILANFIKDNILTDL